MGNNILASVESLEYPGSDDGNAKASRQARRRFEALASLFHERLLMGLVFYADETGTHDPTGMQPGAEFAGIVGYLGWKENWEVFSEQWAGVLNRYGVRVFHMQEFLDEINGSSNPEWPYRGWTQEKKDSYIRSLAKVATENAVAGIGVFVDVRDYHAVWPDSANMHPYHFLLKSLFEKVLSLIAISEEPLPSGEKIAFFFDRQQEFKGLALRMFDLARLYADPEHHLGTIAYADKEEYVPLQAADLLATRMRKVGVRERKGIKAVTPGGWDDELARSHRLYMYYHDASSLKMLLPQLEEIKSFLASHNYE